MGRGARRRTSAGEAGARRAERGAGRGGAARGLLLRARGLRPGAGDVGAG